MEFIFETIYDQKGISVMAEALRKTIRKKRSKRSHICAILIIILAVINHPHNNLCSVLFLFVTILMRTSKI